MKKWLLLILLPVSTLFANAQESFWELYTNALRGDREAQFAVGVIYEKGVLVEANLTQAAHWFLKSAQQDYVDAQYNIGLMYATARGVEENQTAAMIWFRRAADQGDAESRKILEHYGHKEAKGDLNQEAEINISPTVLYLKPFPSVCDERFKCLKSSTIKIVTSIGKRGNFYKINGTIDKRGWKKYPKVGWIHEDEIEHTKP